MVLEVGSGPLISGLVSASRWADLLIYSDLLETNLCRISSTLRSLSSDPACPSLEYIAGLEDSSPEMLRARLGRTVSLVTRCDLLRPGLLTPSLPLTSPPNVLVSKLCLEFSISHTDLLQPTLANLSALLGQYFCLGIIT